VLQDTPSSQTSQGSQATTNTHQKYDLEADIRTVAAYIVQSKASQTVQEAFDRVRNTSTHVKSSTTEQALHQLYDTVQKLSTQVEKNTSRPGAGEAPASYTAVAGQHASAQQNRIQQSCIADTAPFTKQVPVQHKHEIIAIQGSETIAQKNRSYCGGEIGAIQHVVWSRAPGQIFLRSGTRGGPVFQQRSYVDKQAGKTRGINSILYEGYGNVLLLLSLFPI
jgi:hypothetical protein